MYLPTVGVGFAVKNTPAVLVLVGVCSMFVGLISTLVLEDDRSWVGLGLVRVSVLEGDTV